MSNILSTLTNDKEKEEMRAWIGTECAKTCGKCVKIGRTGPVSRRKGELSVVAAWQTPLRENTKGSPPGRTAFREEDQPGQTRHRTVS